MASHVGRFIQDQNRNAQSSGASVVGKGDALKHKGKEGALGGRKPLGDLSNSGKPALTRASKKQPFKNFSTGASTLGKGDAFNTQAKGLGGRKPLGDVSSAGKPVLTQAPKKQSSKDFAFVEEVTEKRIFKASDKVQPHGRNALSDISNSINPHLQKKKNMKLKVVAEEPLCPSAISEEGFLHNHQECIEAQNRAMTTDMDQLLMTVCEYKPESPLRCKNLEDMSDNLDSPPHVFESPKYYTPCEHFDKLSDELEYPPNDFTDSPGISEDPDFKLM